MLIEQWNNVIVEKCTKNYYRTISLNQHVELPVCMCNWTWRCYGIDKNSFERSTEYRIVLGTKWFWWRKSKY